MGAGGVLTSLVRGAVDAFPKADAGQILTKTFTTLESGMRQTDAGNDMADLLKNKYIPLYHQAREKLFQQYSALPKAQQLAPHEIESQARNLARSNTLGVNDYKGVGLIKAVEKQQGMNPQQIHLAQQNLADHVHMFLRDTVDTTDHSDISSLPEREQKAINAKTNIGPQSQFKLNVKNNPNPEIRVRVDTGAKYHPATDTERFFTRIAQKTMLPAIAIPHIGTLFNYGFNTPIQDLVKGLADATFHNSSVRQQVADSGIFASTIADAYAVRHYGARGIIARATGKDQFGVIVNQLTHQPGFNALREWTLSIGAATGKHASERLAQEFAQSGGKDLAAGFQLKRMGLDTAEILNQKGVLNPDQLRKAIFNYVDNKAFLDNTMRRSFNSGANWFTRMSNLYHGYVTRQGQLMADVLKNDILQRKGGIINAAQAFGMLGIVFPAVGTGLKTLEMYGRGQFQTADPAEDFKNLAGVNGGSKMLEQWAEGYAHMAAFGVATSYIRAANRHMLANQLLGPIGNEAANLVEDSIAAVKGKPKPLMRDAVEDTMPDNLGKLIAHQFIPTKKEEEARSGKLHKLKRVGGLKGLKKLN